MSVRSAKGFSLVEVLIACGMAIPLLAVVGCFLFGAPHTLGALSATGRAHAEFLVLREHLARDIQQAASVVERIVLDDALFETRMGPTSEMLVLQLPGVSADGAAVPEVYDFAVYAVQPMNEQNTSFRRQLFTNRDVQGAPVAQDVQSARVPDAAVLVHELAAPPRFTFDRPIASLVREVRLTIAAQATDVARTRRAFPQTFRASFRLRNG